MKHIISRVVAKIETKRTISVIVARYLESASEKKLEFLKNKYKLDDNKMREIEQADPTKNGEYLEWVINQVNKGNLRLPEDVGVINPALNLFHHLKNKRVFKDDNDIRKYNRPGDLYKTLEKYKEKSEETSDMTKRFEEAKGGYKEVVRGPGYVWYVVRTPEAACALGSGTSWCTVQTNYAETYLDDGPLYILYKDNKPKVQIQLESDSFMDEYDNSILEDIGEGTYAKIFGKEVSSLFKSLGKNSTIKTEPDDNILKDPDNAFSYASVIVGGRFPEGEPAISKSVNWSYEYAHHIIKERFPEGEAIISKLPSVACAYAQAVVKGRWPEGEPAISGTPETAIRYAKFVIEGMWPEGEPSISTDARSSYAYAKDIIKGKWPKGEPAISTSPLLSYSYAFDVIHRRFPEGEGTISEDPKFAFRYAMDVMEGRFPKAENSLLKSNYRNHYLNFLYEKGIEIT